MATIGQQLKQARNERGLSIEDVAFQTRIPAARVRDMEGDDLSHFANLTYARGFLKLYGEFLELDLSDYLGQFRTEEFAHASGHEYVQTAKATQNLPSAVFVDHGRARRSGLYMLAVAVLVAGGIVWWNRGGDEEPEQEAKAPVAEQTPPPPPEVPPAPVEPPAPPGLEPPPELVVEEPPAPVPPPVTEIPSVSPPVVESVTPPDLPGTPPKAKVIEEEQ